ncbi:MAG: hypothetical protein DRG30_03115 [Epsilonproteobacteria bacterium]|nr:MAG: hypothetical protein DRG30_03115 [Campylobacterota bacterium]
MSVMWEGAIEVLFARDDEYDSAPKYAIARYVDRINVFNIATQELINFWFGNFVAMTIWDEDDINGNRVNLIDDQGAILFFLFGRYDGDSITVNESTWTSENRIGFAFNIDYEQPDYIFSHKATETAESFSALITPNAYYNKYNTSKDISVYTQYPLTSSLYLTRDKRISYIDSVALPSRIKKISYLEDEQFGTSNWGKTYCKVRSADNVVRIYMWDGYDLTYSDVPRQHNGNTVIKYILDNETLVMTFSDTYLCYKYNSGSGIFEQDLAFNPGDDILPSSNLVVINEVAGVAVAMSATDIYIVSLTDGSYDVVAAGMTAYYSASDIFNGGSGKPYFYCYLGKYGSRYHKDLFVMDIVTHAVSIYPIYEELQTVYLPLAISCGLFEPEGDTVTSISTSGDIHSFSLGIALNMFVNTEYGGQYTAAPMIYHLDVDTGEPTVAIHPFHDYNLGMGIPKNKMWARKDCLLLGPYSNYDGVFDFHADPPILVNHIQSHALTVALAIGDDLDKHTIFLNKDSAYTETFAISDWQYTFIPFLIENIIGHVYLQKFVVLLIESTDAKIYVYALSKEANNKRGKFTTCIAAGVDQLLPTPNTVVGEEFNIQPNYLENIFYRDVTALDIVSIHHTRTSQTNSFILKSSSGKNIILGIGDMRG